MNKPLSLGLKAWLNGLAFILIALLLVGCTHSINDKRVIGETARISLTGSGIEYLARIDTGARVTSVHALDVKVSGGGV